MEFPVFLKEQFNSFVDCYKKYFRQTFGIAISFTILCFIFSAILFRFSDFDESTNSRQLSLLSYFFTRYSEGSTYSIVDLTKTVFIFFAALFSVTLTWFSRNRNEGTEVTFRHSFRALRFNAVLILIFVLLIASMLDYYLFQAENYFSTIASNRSVDLYLRSLCFHLRIYLPLILFAITVWTLTAAHKSSITFKRILWLYISLWLCNEVAFEFFGWIRVHIFGLILLPVNDPETWYIFESILGVPLIACFFLAYYVAMTMPLQLTEKMPVSDANQMTEE